MCVLVQSVPASVYVVMRVARRLSRSRRTHSVRSNVLTRRLDSDQTRVDLIGAERCLKEHKSIIFVIKCEDVLRITVM